MKTQPQAEWLKGIDDDQNIVGLENVQNTPKAQAGRKWFLSKVLAPFIKFGHYETRTGKIRLGDWEHAEQILVVDATSAGTSVITCPATYKYRVEFAKVMNSTRAPLPYVEIVKNGATMDFTGIAAATAGIAIPIIGGAENQANQVSMKGPVELYPAETLTLGDDNFVAADVMEYGFIIRRLPV